MYIDISYILAHRSNILDFRVFKVKTTIAMHCVDVIVRKIIFHISPSLRRVNPLR